MKTTQSLIKDILPEDFCPHYIHLKYNEGIRTEPTESMENGLFFESELLGSARGGKFELPRKEVCNKPKKSASKKAMMEYIKPRLNFYSDAELKFHRKSKDVLFKWIQLYLPKDVTSFPYQRELDILENVDYAKGKMKALEIVIEHVQPHLSNEDRSGHFDALGTIKGTPAIFDVKWTGMSQQQFEREMKYGTLIDDYRTQSRHYQSIDPNKDFYFLVFGKSNWCKVMRFTWNSDAVMHHVETKSDVATVKFENLKDYEIKPDYKQCEGCRLREQCKLRENTPRIEDYD